jgi:hypothetical protein
MAVIVGDDEAAARQASVKPLREERGQLRVGLDELPQAITDLLFTDDSE